MTNAFITKLSRFSRFSDREIAALERLSADHEYLRRGTNLVFSGEHSEVVHLLLSGWAYRYKMLRNGKRQIVGYLLPGDICNLHAVFLGQMDHSIGLLSDAIVVAAPAQEFHTIMERYRSIERALWRAALVDEAILREWVTNMGQREAFSRVGHHLCELWHRMMSVGLVTRGVRFALPLTQEELGDALGLTAVHINRTSKRLKDEGLITLKHKWVTLLDPKRLVAITDFHADYLHLGRADPERQGDVVRFRPTGERYRHDAHSI